MDERLLTDPEESLINLENQMPKSLIGSEHGSIDIRIKKQRPPENSKSLKKSGSQQMIQPKARLTLSKKSNSPENKKLRAKSNKAKSKGKGKRNASSNAKSSLSRNNNIKSQGILRNALRKSSSSKSSNSKRFAGSRAKFSPPKSTKIFRNS